MNAKQANRIRNGIIAAKYATPKTLDDWFKAYDGDNLWWYAYSRTRYRSVTKRLNSRVMSLYDDINDVTHGARGSMAVGDTYCHLMPNKATVHNPGGPELIDCPDCIEAMSDH